MRNHTEIAPLYVMAGPDPAIHETGVDARHKARHDEFRAFPRDAVSL